MVQGMQISCQLSVMLHHIMRWYMCIFAESSELTCCFFFSQRVLTRNNNNNAGAMSVSVILFSLSPSPSTYVIIIIVDAPKVLRMAGVKQ